MEGMVPMPSKTCDALRAAGAPDDKAREAAEEIAGFEDRLTTVESDLKLLKRMVGFTWPCRWSSSRSCFASRPDVAVAHR